MMNEHLQMENDHQYIVQWFVGLFEGDSKKLSLMLTTIKPTDMIHNWKLADI